MTLAAFLATVTTILKSAGIEHMLSGSVGAAYHSMPRATQDVDIVIKVTQKQIERLVGAMRDAGLYMDRGAALDAIRLQSQVNAIDPSRGWKVNFIIRRDRPFSREEFRRRQPAEILDVQTWVATVEDLILAKLEWARLGDSDIQRRDVAMLTRAAGGDLDVAYIEKWLDELGVRAEWEAIIRGQDREVNE